MALLLYLHNFGAATHVATPKCAVLLSPWVAPFHPKWTTTRTEIQNSFQRLIRSGVLARMPVTGLMRGLTRT